MLLPGASQAPKAPWSALLDPEAPFGVGGRHPVKHQMPDTRACGATLTDALWRDTAGLPMALPALSGSNSTDVLIVGGGIAGVTTALHLAEAGVDVVLVEAGQPGDGATGQSGGLVAPDFIRHAPDTIRAMLGRDAGDRLIGLVGGSAGRVFDLISRYGIDCDASQDGFYTPAHTTALAHHQRGLAEQWRACGHDVGIINALDAKQRFGADKYCGALRFADGGSLNPLGYVRGLVRAAVRAGAQLFADSPVEAMARCDDGWNCRTPGGRIGARRLVLAANGGNATLHPAMRRTSLPLHVLQFATTPLDPAQRLAILPGGGALTDKAPYLFTARLDGLGHLISAFPMSFLVRGEQAYHREARRRLRQHFAALPDPDIAYLWQGLAWVNSSFLPELYDLGEGAIAIQACNGRGIATNTALGIEVATFLASGNRDALSVQPRAPKPIPFHAAAALLPKLAMSMAYLSE